LKVKIEADMLKIEFEGLERILGFKKLLKVLLRDISQAVIGELSKSWRDIRAPGTYFPRLIKAGTYYTPRGKEFWYLTKGKTPLTIELKKGEYKRIIIGLNESEAENWRKMLEAFIEVNQ
jgi:hypothetical protein